MIDIEQFIKESKMFFLATVEGDAPKQRPFGELTLVDGKYYMNTNSKKAVFQQMMKNPNISICAFQKGSWIRIEGKAVRETDETVIQKIVKENPFLTKIYEEEKDISECLYLENATAMLYSGDKEPEIWQF